MTTRPFNPAYGSNQKITLVAVTEQHLRINKDAETLRIVNTGATNELYFRTYASGTNPGTALPAPATLASAVDYRLGPGQDKLIAFDYNHDGLSLFSTAGTTVEFMTGTGGVV